MTDDFDAPALDLSVWSPYYLPHWSSRAASAATYQLADSCLTLSIPVEQGLWCAGDHKPDLRVSGVQSGNYSGPVGSTVVMEVFGDALVPGESAAVGMGLKTIRDPAVPQDFEAVRLPIDVREFHTYAVEWSAGTATFSVDGTAIRSCQGAPTYPMQLMLAVFDFPEQSGKDHVPSFVVDHIRVR